MKTFQRTLFHDLRPAGDAPEKAPLPDAKDSTFRRPSPRQVADLFVAELQRIWAGERAGDTELKHERHPDGE